MERHRRERGRQSDNSWGPYVQVYTWDQQNEQSWSPPTRMCGTQAYVSGLALLAGCLPEGQRPPMLPVLP